VFKYRPNIEAIYTWLGNADILKKGDTLIVFGELFGGKYKEEKHPNAKTIQKGVQYCPDNEFMAFDMQIVNQSGESFYLPFMETESLCRAFNLPLAPVMDYGEFEDMLNLNNEFNSYVPEDLGLERLGDNVCEGLVIRPYTKDLYLGNTRVIIKSKNKKFSEKAKVPKNQESKNQMAEIPEEMNKLFDDVCLYLTHNRLQAVQSKIGAPQWNQLKMVSGLLVKDAIEDYEKDQELNSLKDQVGDDWKQFNKQLMVGALELARDYYKREV
jgi:Rnl2 family RNA ligase